MYQKYYHFTVTEVQIEKMLLGTWLTQTHDSDRCEHIPNTSESYHISKH